MGHRPARTERVLFEVGRVVLVSVVGVLVTLSPVEAQSTMYRPPNLGGTWTPGSGVIQFNFVHRFYVAPASGSHKVTNFPTFTLALGLGRHLAIGTHDGTNSLVVQDPYRPNESELFARWRLIGGEGRPGLGVSVQPAYNVAARSADGELSVDYTVGPLTLLGEGRVMSNAFARDTARVALAGGVVARLTDYIAVSGDVGSLVSPATHAAWSAGLSLVIPGTPHTLSLQVSNATTSTIQGNSMGFSKVLYGFEFTIPLHLSRFTPWFHPRRPRAAAADTANVAAEVRMASLKFQPDTTVIAVGQTIRWVNDDPVEHTVTFYGSEASSDLIPARGVFVHTFTTAGTYRYHCTPHPFMTGVVIVR